MCRMLAEQVVSSLRLVRASRCSRAALAVSVALSLMFSGSRAARADVATCVQSHAEGQREAKAGRLKLAAELFASCRATEGCPDAIRAECADFHKDVEKSLPTLIFAVMDAHGADVTNVGVYSGDELLTEGLDGRPVALDPGKHHLRFVLAAGEELVKDVLVREGEKNRIVSVRLPEPVGPKPVVEASAPSSAAASRPRLPAGFWISTGVGAAALASWGVFALLGHGHQSTLDDCSPNCAPDHRDDFDAMRRDYLIADISLGVAVVSAGVSTWLFLANKPASDAPSAAGRAPRISVAPRFSATGGGFVLNAETF